MTDTFWKPLDAAPTPPPPPVAYGAYGKCTVRMGRAPHTEMHSRTAAAASRRSAAMRSRTNSDTFSRISSPIMSVSGKRGERPTARRVAAGVGDAAAAGGGEGGGARTQQPPEPAPHVRELHRPAAATGQRRHARKVFRPRHVVRRRRAAAAARARARPTLPLPARTRDAAAPATHWNMLSLCASGLQCARLLKYFFCGRAVPSPAALTPTVSAALNTGLLRRSALPGPAEAMVDAQQSPSDGPRGPGRPLNQIGPRRKGNRRARRGDEGQQGVKVSRLGFPRGSRCERPHPT